MKRESGIKRIVSIVLLLAMCAFLFFVGRKSADVNLKIADEETENLTSEELTSDIQPHEAAAPEYVHPEDGYYCLLEDGVNFALRGQVGGTCWLYSAVCAMVTAYQVKNGSPIDQFDAHALVWDVFDEDENGGVEGAGEESGGVSFFVINELSQGFGDGYVLDGAIEALNWSIEEYKEGIQKYGALYIGIPDTRKSVIKTTDGYTCLNWPDPGEDDYDHSIAVIGWDDHFPKEYFADEATRDGAWITYNSNRAGIYYYVSYDTPFDQLNDPPHFMSVSDEYAKVLTHDSGKWTENVAGEGEITTANVFKESGTLTAVGTFIPENDSDLTIRILTPDLKEVLHSEEVHADYAGYGVFKLDTPLEVEEYAISVTYPDGAPVEGESGDYGWMCIRTFSNEGESFILQDGDWLDLSLESTWDKIGFVTNNACIRALYGIIER